MKISKYGSTIKAVILFVFLCVMGSMAWSAGDGFAPDPRLVYPVDNTVDLRGKDELVFRWSSFEGSPSERRYFNFTVFHGRQTLEKNVIVKKQLPPAVYSFAVKADMFEDGQVYAWTLSQSYYAKGKSGEAYDAFKVIKK